MTKEYVCECGKKFDHPNKFNGHKSTCKIHTMCKYGTTDVLVERYQRVSKSCRDYALKKEETRQKQLLDKWISEKHRCERCGVVMTEKFGTGRFCSKSCANSRDHSMEVIEKIQQAAQSKGANIQRQNKAHYDDNPSYCEICGTRLSYEKRLNKSCSDHCRLILVSRNLKGNTSSGGLRLGSGIGKHGWYKGFFCDSTYELVYVIYNIDHNIKFDRYRQYYCYNYKGKDRKYYPDFILSDGSLVEIKGYMTEQDKAKIAAVKDRNIQVLFKDDLEYAFNWVRNTYTYEKLEDLYESRK